MSGAAGPRFALARDDLALPPGASARATRAVLTLDGAPVLAFSPGLHRPCLHPVLTPAGFCVTAERPADHPHHAGIWIGADRVAWRAAGGPGETHTYNFYVDEVFQGRAPGTIAGTGAPRATGADASRVGQDLEWRGPREWGAPEGRVVLAERRETRVAADGAAYLIDVVSELRPVGGEVEIGPTRHAWLNVRVAEPMCLLGAGRLTDSRGRAGGAAIGVEGADWVRFTGPVGGGRLASVAVVPGPDGGGGWFAADWGVVTVGPFREAPARIAPGGSLRLAYRVVVADGEIDDASLAAHRRSFAATLAG